eukprot:8472683-Pyramimonas_sp.AAC.1
MGPPQTLMGPHMGSLETLIGCPWDSYRPSCDPYEIVPHGIPMGPCRPSWDPDGMPTDPHGLRMGTLNTLMGSPLDNS